MKYWLAPGDSISFKTNSHRSGWNGQICSNPTNWRCGASLEFRTSECANGSRRCINLNVFAPQLPNFSTMEPSVADLVKREPTFFNDLVMFVYGPNFDIQGGRKLHGGSANSIYGAYRIKKAQVVVSGSRDITMFEPYPDTDILFPSNLVRKPNVDPAIEGVNHLSRISESATTTIVRKVGDLLQELRSNEIITSAMRKKMQRFVDEFPEWQEVAKRRLEVLLPKLTAEAAAKDAAQLNRPKGIVVQKIVLSQVGAFASPATAADDTQFIRPLLPEPGCTKTIEDIYGNSISTAIKIGSGSKNLVLFGGESGTGKSKLAQLLIDDAKRERSEIVTVAADWRSRSDLLGYVNPVSGAFTPTSFTIFLRRAEKAWKNGDRRQWLAIFEEFNLSQPEHWLSDFIVKLEYDAKNIEDRTIFLGGSHIEDDGGPSYIYLPPSLMLVGTLNRDHSVKALTARILDRAAFIEVGVTCRQALHRANVQLPIEMIEALEELNAALAGRDASFSIRTAKSLAAGIRVMGESEILMVLDYVLVQEVLSKVRLLVGVQSDSQLLQKLKDWSERPECEKLAQCRQRITGWDESIEAEKDVLSA